MEVSNLVKSVITIARLAMRYATTGNNARQTIEELEALQNSITSVENGGNLSGLDLTTYCQALQNVAEASGHMVDRIHSEQSSSNSNKIRNKLSTTRSPAVPDRIKITELSLDITRHLAAVSLLMLQEQSSALEKQKYQCHEQERLLSRQQRVIQELENASFGRESFHWSSRTLKALPPVDIHSEIRRPETRATTVNKDELLSWLKAPDGSRIRHEGYSRKRLPDTCEWIKKTSAYKQWSEASNSSCLWLQGRPGVGKSFLMSKMVDDLSALGGCYAYFYMGHGRVQSAWDVAAVLIKQLCIRSELVPQRLEKFYDHYGPGTQPRLDVLLETIDELPNLLDRSKDTTIFLDAWDEPNMRIVPDFEKLFHHITKLSWKVVVTSRKTKPSTLTIDWIGFDMYDGTLIDLEAYIRNYLGEHTPLSNLRDEVSLLESAVQQILKISDRIFFLSEIHVRRILEQPNILDIKNTLSELPGNSRDIIYYALDSTLSQTDNLRNLAYTILVWLANIDRPLSVEGLREGLSVIPSVKAFCLLPQLKENGLSSYKHAPVDIKAFSAALARGNRALKIDPDATPPTKALLGPRGCCNGLVFQEPGTLNVLLAHDEIKAHLKDYRGKEVKEGDFRDYDQEKINLASTYLYYLLSSNFDSGPCETIGLYAKRLKENPFFEHAAVCWTTHAREAGKVDVDFLVSKFLETPKNLASALQVLLLDDVPIGSEDEFRIAYEGSRSMTALQVAAKLNLPHIVEKFLKNGDPLYSDFAANTALHEAMYNRNIEAFKLLFNTAMERTLRQHMGNLTSTLFLDQVKDRQALLDFYIVKVLQNKSLCDTVETQELHGALAWLATGELLSTRNQHGISLLQLAVTSGSIDLVSTLLRFGAEDKESIALIQAVGLSRVDIVKILLERSPTIPAPPPSRVLFEAIKTGNIGITGILLDYRADIDSKIAGGRGVLHEAAASKHAGLVKFLLSRGADACQLDDENRTPLFDAIESEDIIAIKCLLQNGVDIDAPTVNDRLALHEAARVGNEEIFTLILNRSSKMTSRDKALQTPMDIAKAGGHARIVQLLQARGDFFKKYTQSLPDIPKHGESLPESVRHQTRTWPVDQDEVGFKASGT